MRAESVRARVTKAPVPIKLVPVKELDARCKEVHDLIARRAYEFYESRGCVGGQELGDWARAESELLCTVPVGFMQSDHALILDAAVPGFDAEHLQVGVESRRITLSGTREIARAFGRRSRPLEIFRVVELPLEVDPARTTATLKCGILELVAPKAGAAHQQAKAA
jgi:HSP20 family molecular chaperone IbpA